MRILPGTFFKMSAFRKRNDFSVDDFVTVTGNTPDVLKFLKREGIIERGRTETAPDGRTRFRYRLTANGIATVEEAIERRYPGQI